MTAELNQKLLDECIDRAAEELDVEGAFWLDGVEDEEVRRIASFIVKAVFSAVSAQGFVVVPREPTETMIEAGVAEAGDRTTVEYAWRAMISVAEAERADG